MSVDKATALVHAQLYAKEVYKEFYPCSIVLFGSLVNGNFTENSDIDIAVIKDSIDGDFLELSIRLSRLTRDIDLRIEPILLQFDQDHSGFLTTINEYGVKLY